MHGTHINTDHHIRPKNTPALISHRFSVFTCPSTASQLCHGAPARTGSGRSASDSWYGTAHLFVGGEEEEGVGGILPLQLLRVDARQVLLVAAGRRVQVLLPLVAPRQLVQRNPCGNPARNDATREKQSPAYVCAVLLRLTAVQHSCAAIYSSTTLDQDSVSGQGCRIIIHEGAQDHCAQSRAVLALAVAGLVGALVALDGVRGHVELLVLVALPHSHPHARVVRPQLRTYAGGSAIMLMGLVTDTAAKVPHHPHP